jgi:lysophospholipase L1-like esterase
MKSRAVIAAGVCAAVACMPSSALAAKHHKHHKHHKKPALPTYYVALGDSLAVGGQPNAAGVTVATNQGYANDLYATEQKTNKKLKFEDLGCLGETTTSMLQGGKCSYPAGNQVAAAVKFIKSHRIAFVTLDIGANDVDSCATATSVNLPCVTAGLGTINQNVPLIVSALRKATGPKTPIIGMTYYDPFLADWLTGTAGQTLAAESVQLAGQVNTALSAAFTAQSLKIADVATAFNTATPFSVTVPFATGSPYYSTAPLAVATICADTWMCAPAPRGPNIHATQAGYTEIAKVFAAQL